MKKLILSLLVAAGILSSAAFAFPVIVPNCSPMTRTVVFTSTPSPSFTSTYRTFRAFWLSRALVR